MNMDDSDQRPIIIAGPTASGKSALAMALAEMRASCIINADALQVYDCWRILTARPTARDCARVPHALYGHVDGSQRYSVGDWLRDIAVLLADLHERDVRPIIVGGTGLYLTALTQGLADIPQIPSGIRDSSEAILSDHGVSSLVEDLARDDPETLARIDVRNPVRVQRAWEVLKATGRGLAAWQRAPVKPVLMDWRGYVVQIDISILNSNIRCRFDEMIEDGAIDECQAYRRNHPERRLPSSRALGAAQIFDYLDGRCDLESATESAVIATRGYAKRQRTWFRNRMADWPRIDPRMRQIAP
jgi:tRNA dimethylallyltransferase